MNKLELVDVRSHACENRKSREDSRKDQKAEKKKETITARKNAVLSNMGAQKELLDQRTFRIGRQ